MNIFDFHPVSVFQPFLGVFVLVCAPVWISNFPTKDSAVTVFLDFVSLLFFNSGMMNGKKKKKYSETIRQDDTILQSLNPPYCETDT